MFGGIIIMTGAAFRLIVVATETFIFVLIGQIIAALAQAFLQNPVAKLATTWFGDKERGTATAFGSMAMPVGCLVAFMLPNLFFDADKEIEKKDFEFYLII